MQPVIPVTGNSIFRRLSQWFRSLCSSIAASFRAHLLGYQASGALLFAAITATIVTGQPFSVFLFFSTSLAAVLLAILGVAALYKFWRMIWFERPDSPIFEFARWMRDDILNPVKLANGLHAVLIINFMGMGFGLLKASIPILIPFAWDQSFSSLDRILHFGWYPWEILQPILGYPLVSFLISFMYSTWFFVLPGFFVWLGFMRGNPPMRMQYIVASIICWGLGGNLFATLLSSAGPCFFEPLGITPNPYAPLMAYLNDVNSQYSIWALNFQDMLWKGYQGQEIGVNMISAMPSMHMASSILFVLVAFQVSRRFGIIMSLYAFMIFAGSIHLGWHYAVDSYFGIFLAWVCWHFAGRLVDWDRARQAGQVQDPAAEAM